MTQSRALLWKRFRHWTWQVPAIVAIVLLLLPVSGCGCHNQPPNVFRRSEKVRCYLRASDEWIDLTDAQRDRIGELLAQAPPYLVPNDGKLYNLTPRYLAILEVKGAPKKRFTLYEHNLVSYDKYRQLSPAENREIWELLLGRELGADASKPVSADD